MKDDVMLEVKEAIMQGWPMKGMLSQKLIKYYSYRDELTVHEDIIL